jgi:hypothetical protein
LGETFFRTLPRQAGVYFFYDGADRLLYIGQSNNLRARVGSYRHVNFERHARRTMRLVHRVRRIEWEICENGDAAIERERELLLERRPPFNRAGVWQAPPWWLRMKVLPEALHLSVTRGDAAPDETDCQPFGPFRASFPFVYAALVRAALRHCRPDLQPLNFPAGYLGIRLVAEVALATGTMTKGLAESLAGVLHGRVDAMKEGGIFNPAQEIQNGVEHTHPLSFEEQLWAADAELLHDFHERQAAITTDLKAGDASHASLTPHGSMISFLPERIQKFRIVLP